MIGVERTVGWRDLCVLEGQQTILRIHLLFKDIKRAGAEKNAGPTEIQPTAASQELKQCNRHAEQKLLKNKVKDSPYMQDICERNKAKGNEDRDLWRSDHYA